MRGFRSIALLALVVATIALVGCRRGGGGGPVDPTRPDSLAPCPESAPHLVVGLQSTEWDGDHALVRLTSDLRACRGLVLPRALGNVTTVGGLSDGTDLVGFGSDYGGGGSLVRFDADGEVGRVESASDFPLSVATVIFRGQPALAVAWGSRSSSDQGERVAVYALSDFAMLGSWDVSWELVRVAPSVSGQAERITGTISGDLQEYRADPGGSSLATTGEVRVASPSGSGYFGSIDVHGAEVRAVVDRGVLSWRAGLPPAFLGPVSCRWPATADTVLPMPTAEYLSGVVALDAPEETIVLVSGELEGGSGAITHLYTLWHRGECRIEASFARRHRAVAIAWAGR
jgi:hypothetical protein